MGAGPSSVGGGDVLAAALLFSRWLTSTCDWRHSFSTAWSGKTAGGWANRRRAGAEPADGQSSGRDAPLDRAGGGGTTRRQRSAALKTWCCRSYALSPTHFAYLLGSLSDAGLGENA